MDMETVLVAADAIKRLKMYPYFDVAHYILNCMSVRDDTYPQLTTGTWPGRSAVTFSVLACFTCVLPACISHCCLMKEKVDYGH